jgi:hypothetical protein
MPLGGRRVVIVVSVRRLKCGRVDCVRQTFREQLPGVLERYQRRTPRLVGQINTTGFEFVLQARLKVRSADEQRTHNQEAGPVG